MKTLLKHSRSLLGISLRSQTKLIPQIYSYPVQGIKIYTKTGDKGTSSLFTGDRAQKDDKIFECLGSIDETNAFIGLAREHCVSLKQLDPKYLDQLADIQARLLDLGSQVATPRKSDEIHEKKLQHTLFSKTHVENLELWIDEMESKLPPLKNFILPSGGLAAATLHSARTICRRSERNLVKLLLDEQIEEHSYQFVNRLSDYLFQLARICAQTEGKDETVYKKAKVRE